MPYGLKRGVKNPGEYNFADMFGLALAGATGIIAALVTDYQQKGEASALYTINQWVVSASRMIGLGDTPLWVVVIGLISLGAGSIFYFQPITRQGAFAQGFGLLAVMMTAVPADLAGALQNGSGGGELLELEAAAQPGEARVVEASYRVGDAQVVQVQQRSAAKYEVNLTVNFPNGLPADIDTLLRRGSIRGRLHNADTGATYNLFRAGGGSLERRGNALFIRAGVPARSNTATLWVRIEAEKYVIEQRSADAALGESLDWTIDMQPSDTPLFVQRLNQSYWF